VGPTLHTRLGDTRFDPIAQNIMQCLSSAKSQIGLVGGLKRWSVNHRTPRGQGVLKHTYA
jgi:hypothetical protein